MKKIKKLFIRIFIIGFGFCLIIVAITSTTKFQYQKNPMENFFSQHKSIDSTSISKSIPREQVIKDIDFLVSTIEDVHPDPYYSISKEKFYFLVDSIKGLIHDEITREDLYHLLKPLIGRLKDGHTNVNFPEISNQQDNASNFEKEHKKASNLIEYSLLEKNTGYVLIKDFTLDIADFKNQLNQIFEQIETDSITDLILDIRNNPGGNSILTDLLTSYFYDKAYKTNSKIIIKRSEQYYSYLTGYFSWWFKPFLRFIKQIDDYKNTPIGENYVEVKGEKTPQKTEHPFKGDINLLINSSTFSTALGFATSFKDNNMGTIIGEQTHADVNGFADIYPFDLPNSGLWIWCSTKFFIRPNGEMTKGGLKPDFFVKDEDEKILEFTTEFIRDN